jgi:hypothetical protein
MSTATKIAIGVLVALLALFAISYLASQTLTNA